MRTPARLLLATAFALVLVSNGISHAGKFLPIDINKSNQKERSKDYFSIEVAKEVDDCIQLTVYVKANPADKRVRSSLARLEVVEGDKRVAWIPLDRQDRPDGNGHVIKFGLAPDLVKKSTLILVQLTMEAGGNVYRVDLKSYTQEQAKQEKKAKKNP